MYVLFAVNFLMVFICFTVLVPSTPAVTKNNRQKLYIYEEKIHSKFHCCKSCTFANNTQILDVFGVAHPCWRCTQFGVITRVARSPKTPIHWMFSELHVRAGVARNLELYQELDVR